MASMPSTNGTESVIGEFKARRQLLDVFHVENGEFLQRLATSDIDAHGYIPQRLFAAGGSDDDFFQRGGGVGCGCCARGRCETKRRCTGGRQSPTSIYSQHSLLLPIEKTVIYLVRPLHSCDAKDDDLRSRVPRSLRGTVFPLFL